MLERLQQSVDPRPSSVAYTAMDTAIRQQEDFEETAEEIRTRQEQEKAERQRKAREDEELRARNSGHAVDLFVNDSTTSSAEAAEQPDQRGSAVDVEI